MLLLCCFCGANLQIVIVLCFVVRYFMSILILQSSWWGRESWLLCLVCLPGVSWWLNGSSSGCHGVVCGLWLWYFLIILTYYFCLGRKESCLLLHVNMSMVGLSVSLCLFLWVSMQAHDVKTTSYRSQCDVMTSHWRWYDVILRLYAYRVVGPWSVIVFPAIFQWALLEHVNYE